MAVEWQTDLYGRHCLIIKNNLFIILAPKEKSILSNNAIQLPIRNCIFVCTFAKYFSSRIREEVLD